MQCEVKRGLVIVTEQLWRDKNIYNVDAVQKYVIITLIQKM